MPLRWRGVAAIRPVRCHSGAVVRRRHGGTVA